MLVAAAAAAAQIIIIAGMVVRTSAAAAQISNGIVSASISAGCQLESVTRLEPASPSLTFASGDDWAVEVNGFRFVGSALRGSLSVSQPSPSEFLCVWDMPPMPGETFTIMYSVPPGQAFVQKALNVSCTHGGCTEPRHGDRDAPLAISQVTPVLGLRTADNATVQFSEDAGGVFMRLNSTVVEADAADAHVNGLMVVVQNKHTQLNAPAAGCGENLTWTEYPGKTYTCASDEYKGTAVDANGTAAGCMAAAEAKSRLGLGINYATYRPSSPGACYVCDVLDAAAKLKPAEGYITFVGVSSTHSKPSKHSGASIELSYAAGLPSHPMLVPASEAFEADLVIIAPYEQAPPGEPLPWPKSVGGTGLQQPEYEVFWAAAQAFMVQSRYKTPGAETVKMHVPWTANFLEEVDTSRPENLAQAKRVISRCSEIGVKHILWSARDSRVVTHEQATDSWQWGASLWLTMGEKLVSGEWLPSDSNSVLPPSLTSLLEFATEKGVSLCPYIYPSLGLGRGINGSSAWLFGGAAGQQQCKHIPCSKGVSSRLASRPYQDFLIKELLAFLKKTKSMGMGFDYTFINDNEASAYSCVIH